jgi:hypothetical protein
MKDGLWSADLFSCESLALRAHWVLVVMDRFTRRIVGFGTHEGSVDGVALCRMFRQAIQRKSLPQRLSTDNDPLFQFHQWQANLRVLESGLVPDPDCRVIYEFAAHTMTEPAASAPDVLGRRIRADGGLFCRA